MELSQVLLQLLNSISYGLLLFLLAAGLSLIFGLMGVINLAHGSYYMLGAYIGITLMRSTDSLILALIVAAAIVGLIGTLIELLFIRKVYNRVLDQVLLTFGCAYIFMDVTRWLWGGAPLSFPKPQFLEGSISILGQAFPIYRFVIILWGLILALVLYLCLEKTSIGVIIKAGVDDKEMVTGMGINIKLYFTGIFTFGAFLAAMGGVLGGPIVGAYIGLDFDILILALAVVVVGGLGTLKGAFLGSMLIGFIENFGNTFFPSFAIMTIYIVMALILIIKPTGLFGKDELQ